MKIKTPQLALIVFIVIFGGIGLSEIFEIWSTTADKTPATYKDGENAGSYNPEDIRGSYSFEKIATFFEIDVNVLYQAFGIPKETDPSAIFSKDIEALYADTGAEIGNESMQVFVALYKNLPIEIGTTALPKQAVDLILSLNPSLLPEQIQSLKNNTVVIESKGETQTQTPTQVTPISEPAINGSTTFQQALDLGISKEQIEKVIGDELPATNQTIKDFCTSQGIAFSGIKTQLLELVK